MPSSTNLASGNAEFRVSGSVVYLPPGKFNEILYDYHLLRPTTGFGGTNKVDLSQSGQAVSMTR